MAAVAMGGGDILPALEKGALDAAEWCCPKPDMTFGFHKVLKHYYMQGLHQVVVNADMYLNKKVWDGLSPDQKKAIEVSADASLMQTHRLPHRRERQGAEGAHREARRDPARHAEGLLRRVPEGDATR